MKPFLPQFAMFVVSTLALPVCLAATPSAQQVRQLATQGSVQEAKFALTECGKRQNAECQLMLAEWIERGELFPRDMNAARELYEQALKNGEHAAGPHILRLLREEALPSTAHIAPSSLVTPVKAPPVAAIAAMPQQHRTPPVPLLVPVQTQKVVSPTSLMLPRDPANCESRISGRISILSCEGLLLAMQPVAQHGNQTLVLVRAENRRSALVWLDHSQFEFSQRGQPIPQAVDATMAIAIDEGRKDAKSDNLVKGVFASALAIAATAFMNGSGLDLLDLDPAYMLANGIGNAAGDAAWSSFKEARSSGNKTTVGYINQVELPPATFAEGLLAIEGRSAVGVSVTFTSPYGSGTIGISGL